MDIPRPTLLKSIKKKNKLYKQYLSNPSSQKEEKYKTYKNKLNHSLRIAKRLYYDKRLNESKFNMRATWRLLNEVLNSKKLRPKSNSVFKVGDQEISDPMETEFLLLSIEENMPLECSYIFRKHLIR